MAIEEDKQRVVQWIEASLPVLVGKVRLVSDRDASVSPGTVQPLPYATVQVAIPFDSCGGIRHNTVNGVLTITQIGKTTYTITIYGEEGEEMLAELRAKTRFALDPQMLSMTPIAAPVDLSGLDNTSFEGRYAQDYLSQSLWTYTGTGAPNATQIEVEYHIKDSKTPVPVPFVINYPLP